MKLEISDCKSYIYSKMVPFWAYLEFVDLEDFMDLDLDQSTGFDLVYYVLI